MGKMQFVPLGFSYNNARFNPNYKSEARTPGGVLALS
jgi:hypothetical protein